ncbi:MAG: hypothetical protein ACOYLB_05305 [Phototrophicaceae bacterium]
MPDTPILKLKPTASRPPLAQPRAVWWVRLLGAGVLTFATEGILWWYRTHPLQESLLIFGLHLALVGLLLDGIVRFKVRELFGELILLGGYVVLAAPLMYPDLTLAELPRTFATRVMGGMFISVGWGWAVIWQILHGWQPNRATALGFGLGGLLWGVWLLESPALIGQPATQWLEVVTVGGLGSLLIALITPFATRPATLTADDFRLTRLEGGITLAVMVGSALYRLSSSSLILDALPLLSITLGFIVLILWFQSSPKAKTLLHRTLPLQPIAYRSLITSLCAFVGVGLISLWLLGEVTQIIPLADITSTLVALVGLAWLPTVALVLGVRAYRWQVRTGRNL